MDDEGRRKEIIPTPQVLVTCLCTATGEQAVISESTSFDEGEPFYDIFPYDDVELEIKGDVSEFYQADPHREYNTHGSIRSEVRFVWPSAQSYDYYTEENEEPQLDDSYLSFAMTWVPQNVVRGYGTPPPRKSLDSGSTLFLLEHGFDFT